MFRFYLGWLCYTWSIFIDLISESQMKIKCEREFLEKAAFLRKGVGDKGWLPILFCCFICVILVRSVCTIFIVVVKVIFSALSGN